MTAKIVRVLLVFTTILILGFYLPDLFRSRFAAKKHQAEKTRPQPV